MHRGGDTGQNARSELAGALAALLELRAGVLAPQAKQQS